MGVGREMLGEQKTARSVTWREQREALAGAGRADEDRRAPAFLAV